MHTLSQQKAQIYMYKPEISVILQEENNLQEDQNVPESCHTPSTLEKNLWKQRGKWGDADSWIDSWNYKLRVHHQQPLEQLPKLSQTGREKKW